MNSTLMGMALFLIFSAMTPAQSEPAETWALGVNYYALTFHPGGGGAEYPRQFDDKAYWVLQVGGEAYADYYLKPWFLLRGAGSLYKDCADVWAGFAHFGFRFNWNLAQRLAFRIGIGPSFLWRESWLGVVDRYRADAFFGRPKKTDRFQSAWIGYGGNLEAEYKVTPRLGLIYSVVPGFPLVVTNSLGLRAGF
ncbi:MAG: hypothetical protein M3Y08_10725 [Fibrobacterota bacterium]|nr:hypothetical protein [Fibrobacterota bacterium]